MKFSHYLFQAGAFSTAQRHTVAVLASAAMFALAGCGGGVNKPNSSVNTTPPPKKQETPHKVDIPLGNKLADWLTNNRDRPINVRAGEFFDAGGVRFTCSSSGDDCLVMVTLVEDSITVTSAGGMATATLVQLSKSTSRPRRTTSRPRRDEGDQPTAQSFFEFSLPWLHGLNTVKHILPSTPSSGLRGSINRLLQDKEAVEYLFSANMPKVFGRVRFTCNSAQKCEIEFQRNGDIITVKRIRGNVTSSQHYDPKKIFSGIEWVTGNSKFCNPTVQTCLEPYEFDEYIVIGGPVRSNELYFEDRGSSYFLVEDKTARIPANHGWKAKRYVLDLSRYRSWRGALDVDQKMEAIFYTHASGLVNYGRWLRIDGPNHVIPFLRTADGSFGNAENSLPSLGTLKDKVTYRGGATGYYALMERRTEDLVTREADAGHFTARATFQADLNDDTNLWIEGSIHDFVDQYGQKMNWSVELQREQFSEVDGGDPRSFSTGGRLQGKPTIWTIDGITADPNPERNWDGYVTSNSRFLIGAFQAVHGTDGHMVGSFGAER